MPNQRLYSNLKLKKKIKRLRNENEDLKIQLNQTAPIPSGENKASLDELDKHTAKIESLLSESKLR
jgi:hypothetical protein